MWRRIWNWITRQARVTAAEAAQDELREIRNAKLHGGFTIESVTTSDKIGVDAIGRPAVAHTRTIGRRMVIVVQLGLSSEEVSISLYHEVLEAATASSAHPPASVQELNEAGFDEMALLFHAKLGPATIESLSQMLKELGF